MSTRAPRQSQVTPGIWGIGRHVDPGLMLLIGTLLCAGLVMLTSSSISLAERNTGNPFFYLERQLGAVHSIMLTRTGDNENRLHPMRTHKLEIRCEAARI